MNQEWLLPLEILFKYNAIKTLVNIELRWAKQCNNMINIECIKQISTVHIKEY